METCIRMLLTSFWKVVQVFDDDTIEVETRRGKRNRLDKNCPQLRKVGFLERLIFRNRFF